MISPCSALRLRIVCILIVSLFAMAPGELLAIQIAPNPNPEFNTITIIPAAPGENLVPFTNQGIISIQPSASLSNASRFENAGGIFNAGTITNSDLFINNRVFTLLEGSQFNNLATGTYSGLSGSIGIAGTFVNEGTVTHSLGHITVGETGEYIQRQAVGSNVTPTTITPDAPFTNAGRVHIAAGDFIIDPRSVRAASATYDQTSTGRTQVDARFQNIGGTVRNAGTITIGATGEYRQQGFPGPMFAGSTSNTGTFSNAGMTNINTGVFENARFFTNTGAVRIGEGATFTNTDSGIYHQSPGGTTKIDGKFVNNFAVQNGGAIAVSTTGSFSQVAGTSSIGTGTGNGGTFTNAGQVNIGQATTFSSFVIPDRTTSSGQYVQQASGTTRIDGTFDTRGYVTNAGAITVGATGQYVQSLDVIPGIAAASTTNSGTYTNAGTVRIGEGTFFNNFSNRQGLPVAQYIQQANGTTQIDGTFQNGGARVENAGRMTVTPTGTYTQVFNKFVPVESTTVNTGTFTNAGTTVVNGGTFTNQGSLVNSGTLQVGVVGPAVLVSHGGVVNSGTFEVAAAGQVTGSGSYVQNAAAAQTIVNGTFAHNLALQAGTLNGAGTITATVMNTGGVVQPGSLVHPGVLTLASYVQGPSGRLDLKLGGLLAGSYYDVLKVIGSGIFGGSLSLRLINGFTPALGHRFDLLTCSLGCSGSNGGSLFSGGVSLPSLSSGLSWISELTKGGTAFSYTVIASAASAPEPGTLLLIGSGFIGLIAWKQRRRKKRVG